MKSDIEYKANKAIEVLFSTEAKQFANLTSLQLDGWDIRSHDVGQIVSWMKQLENITKFSFMSCYMGCGTLEQILDGIWEFLEAHPVEEQKEEQKKLTYDFSQRNRKHFLNTDDAMNILYNFLKKVAATDRVIDLKCSDGETPMHEWQRDTDGSMRII